MPTLTMRRESAGGPSNTNEGRRNRRDGSDRARARRTPRVKRTPGAMRFAGRSTVRCSPASIVSGGARRAQSRRDRPEKVFVPRAEWLFHHQIFQRLMRVNTLEMSKTADVSWYGSKVYPMLLRPIPSEVAVDRSRILPSSLFGSSTRTGDRRRTARREESPSSIGHGAG